MRRNEGVGCCVLLMKDGRRLVFHRVAVVENGFGFHADGQLYAGLTIRSWRCVWEDEEHQIAATSDGCKHCEVAVHVA